MKNRYLAITTLVLLLLGSSDPAFAAFKSDSLFFKPFSRLFSARTLIGFKELSISISNSSKINGSTSKVIYKPNNGIIGGVGLSYRNILLSYYFNISNSEVSNSKYGKTSVADYQLNLTTKFFYISGFHRTYNGFYVSKPYESYPKWEAGMPYPQRADIKYLTKGIETIVNLNPRRYSLNASIKITEQQLKSVFSTLIYSNYSLTSVSADSSLIPGQLRSSFFDGKELYQSKFFGWTIMPGVSYCFVKSKLFINPMIFSGFGYLQKELLFTNKETNKNRDYYLRSSIRLNCGYSSKLFFAGTFIEWNEMFLPEKSLMIKTENFNLMLMFGLRF